MPVCCDRLTCWEGPPLLCPAPHPRWPQACQHPPSWQRQTRASRHAPRCIHPAGNTACQVTLTRRPPPCMLMKRELQVLHASAARNRYAGSGRGWREFVGVNRHSVWIGTGQVRAHDVPRRRSFLLLLAAVRLAWCLDVVPSACIGRCSGAAHSSRPSEAGSERPAQTGKPSRHC